MKKYKIIDSELCICLGGGFEFSCKVVEYNNYIYVFCVYNESQNVYVYRKEDYKDLFNRYYEEEGTENITPCDIFTSEWEFMEEDMLGYGVLGSLDDKYFYDKDYINNYLDIEIKKYFSIVTGYDRIIKNLQSDDPNGTWDEIILENKFDYIQSIKELKYSLNCCIDEFKNDIECYEFYKEQLNLLNDIF